MKKHANKHHCLARRKMSHILDEIFNALLHYGSDETDMRIHKEENGLRLRVEGGFLPEHRQEIERMGELLRPDVRSAAMVEEYWELTGEDQYADEGELSLVGQMADEAKFDMEGNCVRIELFVEY